MSFDDFQPAAPEPVAAPQPEPESDLAVRRASSAGRVQQRDTRLPALSLDEMQRVAEAESAASFSAAPEPSAPAPAAASPWDEPEAPAFGGETRAFPKLSFDDFQQTAPETPAEASWDRPSDASPFGSDVDEPAFGGETRAFPKLSFDDFQQQPTPAPRTRTAGRAGNVVVVRFRAQLRRSGA